MEPKDMGIFEIKEKISKKDFLRAALVNIGLNQETPMDIFDSEFEDVATENCHFVGVGGSAEVKCSASVGHTYYVEETKYNEFSKKFEKNKVKKTNWTPYQTTYKAEKTWGFAENSENPSKNEFPDYVVTSENRISLSGLSQEELQEKGIKEIDSSVLDRAHKAMISEAEYQCKNTLPGDTYKNVTCDTKESIKWYTNLVIARHSMKYRYAGKAYSIEQYANGRLEPQGQLPEKGDDEKADNKVKTLGIASFIISVILVVLFVRFRISATIAAIIFALSTALFAIYEWFEITDRKRRSTGKWITKRKALVEMLAKNGLEPLNEQEQKNFNDIIKNAHKLKFGIFEGMPICAYILSVFFLLFSYSSTLLAGFLVYIPLALVAILVIKGVMVWIKSSK